MIGVRGEKQFIVDSPQWEGNTVPGSMSCRSFVVLSRGKNVGAPTILLNIIYSSSVILILFAFSAEI